MEIQNQKFLIPFLVGCEGVSALGRKREETNSLLISPIPIITKSTEFGLRDNWVPVRTFPFTVGPWTNS